RRKRLAWRRPRSLRGLLVRDEAAGRGAARRSGSRNRRGSSRGSAGSAPRDAPPGEGAVRKPGDMIASERLAPGEGAGGKGTRPPLSLPLAVDHDRSEEHTSELQSRENLVCRLLLEKKKNNEQRGPRTEP